jgi:uncharacterized membrane protein YdjX (TVP38/TMEM64 family)
MEENRNTPGRKFFIAAGLLATSGLLYLIFIRDNASLGWTIPHLRQALENGHQLRESFLAYGLFAPFIFIILQVLQVVLAPIPGEATGLLGGYLFGLWPGFIYSSVALTIGSGLAFSIGKFFSGFIQQKYKETRIYQRFNHLVSRGDFVIPFLLFLLPGFPKDSLSYLLGLSLMPFKVFLFIAAVARMPGTLMLSLQGAKVYEAQYVELMFLLLASLAVSLPCYRYRKKLLALLTRYNNRK